MCLVQTTASPPHAAVVDPSSDSVLLALDPEGAVESAAQGALAAARPPGASSTAGAAAMEEDTEEVISMRPRPQFYYYSEMSLPGAPPRILV